MRTAEFVFTSGTLTVFVDACWEGGTAGLVAETVVQEARAKTYGVGRLRLISGRETVRQIETLKG